MQRNNRAFTYAIHALFQFLKTWEDDGTGQGSQGSHSLFLDLFDIYSPMDHIHRPPAKLEDDKVQHHYGKRHDLFENRYKRSLLHLLEHPELPILSCVSRFRIYTIHRPIANHSAVLLAAKLPNAESITLHLKDDEKTDARVRQQYRHDLAIALPTIFTLPIRDFTLCFSHEDPSNEYFSLPSALLPSAPSTDHLSLTLHTFSQSPSLTSIRLAPIIISPDLYWPANASIKPAWPNLRQFHVEFNRTAPDGTWYFVRDPSKPEDEDEGGGDSDDPDEEVEDDSDPEFDFGSDSFFSTSSSCPDTFNERGEARAVGDYPIRFFRTLPMDTHVNPLLLAMARAAACMPRMRDMSLTSTVRDSAFVVSFYAAGQASPLDTEPVQAENPRLYLCMGTWRPDDEILEVWHENREGLLVKFIEW
ncbi:MAG: hypothetical protein Q9208_001417 [Pyrenodesmia sp. 3 TL-2023]